MYTAIASGAFNSTHMNGGDWAIVVAIILLILAVTQSGSKKSKA